MPPYSGYCLRGCKVITRAIKEKCIPLYILFFEDYS